MSTNDEPHFNHTTLLANSVDEKLIIFFLIFPENSLWQFIQIVSLMTIVFLNIEGNRFHQLFSVIRMKRT